VCQVQQGYMLLITDCYSVVNNWLTMNLPL